MTGWERALLPAEHRWEEEGEKVGSEVLGTPWMPEEREAVAPGWAVC